MQADALQHPLRRDADVLAEQPLQRALGVAGVARTSSSTVIGPLRASPRTARRSRPRAGRPPGPCARIPASIAAIRSSSSPAIAIGAKTRGHRDRAVGQRVRGDRVERVEAAGPELRRHHDPRAPQLAPEALRDDAVDQVRVGLEDHVEARVRDDLLRERLLEVPRDHPVAVDEVREVLGREVAGEPEMPLRGIRVEDAAAAVEIGRLHPSDATPRPPRPRARRRA